jgi:hypothetical protein
VKRMSTRASSEGASAIKMFRAPGQLGHPKANVPTK